MAKTQGRWAGGRVLLVSLWLMLFVLVVKLWAGWAALSLSLVAESLYTMVGGFSLLLSLIASTSRQVKGRETPGHGQLEGILALLLVGFLGFTSISLLLLSGHQMRAIATSTSPTVALDSLLHVPMLPSALLLQILSGVIAISFGLACFQRYRADSLENPVLRSNARFLFRDMWLSVLALAGLAGNSLGMIWLDPLLAIPLVFVALVSCWRMFNRQLPLLIKPMAIAPEALAQTIRQVEGITHCYSIQSRGIVGRQVLVEMRLILHPEFLSLARTIAERVDRMIQERYGPAKVVIYIDGDVAVGARIQESEGLWNQN